VISNTSPSKIVKSIDNNLLIRHIFSWVKGSFSCVTPCSVFNNSLVRVLRYGTDDDLVDVERVNTSIDSRSLYCLLGGQVLHLVVLSLSRYTLILRATVWYRDNRLVDNKVLCEACFGDRDKLEANPSSWLREVQKSDRNEFQEKLRASQLLLQASYTK
jgi:hypothetical protein